MKKMAVETTCLHVNLRLMSNYIYIVNLALKKSLKQGKICVQNFIEQL